MSKSNGTGVFLDLDSQNLYGAIMAQSDGMIRPLFLGCTRVSLEEIEENVKMENPRDAKMRLAFEIVRIFHGEEKASEAQEDFVSTIQKKGIPDNVEEVEISEGESVLDFMIKSGLAESKSDARRKIEQGGVSVNGKSINASTLILNKKEHDGKIIKVGKRNFRKIVF